MSTFYYADDLDQQMDSGQYLTECAECGIALVGEDTPPDEVLCGDCIAERIDGLCVEEYLNILRGPDWFRWANFFGRGSVVPRNIDEPPF